MKDLLTAMCNALGATSEAFAAKFAEYRFLPVHGKLDTDTAGDVSQALLALEMKKIAPITLLISSSGGSVSAGYRIGDIIQTLQSPVDGLVVDYAGSMAVDLLLMCRKRRALPHAEIFVHFIRCGFEMIMDSHEITPGDIDALRRKMTAGQKTREEFYAKRLGKTTKEVHELFRMGDKFKLDYTAAEALALGIIDEVDTTFKFFPDPTAKTAVAGGVS